MADWLQNASLKNLTYTGDGVQATDIRMQHNTIEYHESIFDPSIHMEIGIQDTIGFMDLTPIRSGGRLNIKIEHETGEITYGDTNPLILSNIVNNLREGKREFYTLQGETKGTYDNQMTRVSGKYKGNIGDSVEKILKDVMQVPEDKIDVEQTLNGYHFMGNMKKPLYCIAWLRNRSIPHTAENSTTKGHAGFLFWEDMDGYHYKSVESILKEEPEFEYEYREDGESIHTDTNFKLIAPPIFSTNHDVLKKLRDGAYKSTNIFFDLLTRLPALHEYSWDDGEHTTMGADEPIPEIAASPSRRMLGLVDIGAMAFEEPPEGETASMNMTKYQAQAVSRLSNLFSQTLNITVPLNLKLRVGAMITCKLPKLNTAATDFRSSPAKGSYMITRLSHKFLSKGAVTALELVRDSYEELK